MFDHDIMIIAQNIMMFACDIMVFIHEIIGGGGHAARYFKTDPIHISGNRKKGPIHISCLRKKRPIHIFDCTKF